MATSRQQRCEGSAPNEPWSKIPPGPRRRLRVITGRSVRSDQIAGAAEQHPVVARPLLAQKDADLRAQLNIAGVVTGYRRWRASTRLLLPKEHDVQWRPTPYYRRQGIGKRFDRPAAGAERTNDLEIFRVSTY
jgi:hypothetical protein